MNFKLPNQPETAQILFCSIKNSTEGLYQNDFDFMSVLELAVYYYIDRLV